MDKTIVSTAAAPAAIGPYAQAVSVGNFLFTSGQIALDPDTGTINGSTIDEQSRQVLDNLVQVLTAAGATTASVVKTTCYLSDMDNFSRFNDVYAQYFPDQPPARSCVEVARLPKDVLIEIDAIAVLQS